MKASGDRDRCVLFLYSREQTLQDHHCVQTAQVRSTQLHASVCRCIYAEARVMIKCGLQGFFGTAEAASAADQAAVCLYHGFQELNMFFTLYWLLKLLGNHHEHAQSAYGPTTVPCSTV
jgi:hypothetical protein